MHQTEETQHHGLDDLQRNDAKSLAPFHFSTKQLPEHDQFAAWRDFISETVDVSLVEGQERGFSAEQTIWDLGSLVLAQASMPGAGATRTWRHLSKDPVDHWCLVLVPASGPQASADSAHVVPGTMPQLGIRSLARPFQGAGADTEVLTLYVPRDLFRESAHSLDAAPNDIPNTGLGGLLYDYMRSLAQRVPTVTTAELPNLIEATRAMITACIVPTADRVAAAQGTIATTLLERARQVVHVNLASPSLGPDELCLRLGVSRSRLYRLFEPLGGVSRYIQRQRLLQAHVAVSTATEVRPIASIAEGLGFSDASVFSRAFRQEFGYSPSDARLAGLSGGARPLNPPPKISATFSDLGKLLRSLQV